MINSPNDMNFKYFKVIRAAIVIIKKMGIGVFCFLGTGIFCFLGAGIFCLFFLLHRLEIFIRRQEFKII